MARRYYSSIAQRTTLSGSILSGATTIAVVAVTGFPSTKPYTLILDQDTVNEEVVTVTASSGTTLTVTRGVDGTTGVAHSAGATVNHGVSARDFDEPNAFLNAGTLPLVTAKGDLLAATANGDVDALAVGTNDDVLTADSAEATGMKWAAIPAAAADATKADKNVTQNTQTGTTYTFVLADVGKIVTASNAAAQTYTVPPQADVGWLAGAVLDILNLGAGTVTIAAGAGVTINGTPLTLAATKGGSLVRTASNVWTFIPFSGGVEAGNFTNAATGTYTTGGISYKYITFTGIGDLIVDQAGFADILVIGGGGGGGNTSGGGGAGGYLPVTSAYFTVGSHTVVVGAGGAGAIPSGTLFPAGANGITSRLGSFYGVGGGAGGGNNGGASVNAIGFSGGSGGGGGTGTAAGGAGTSGQGNTGGSAAFGSTTPGGGGGGANAVGSNAATNVGGAGGAGISSSITNSAVTRSGGGGGGVLTGGTAGAGGAGGGGAGTTNNTTGGAGGVNLGGGGGGGGYTSTPGGGGGNGGSGIVIVRVVV